MILNDIYVAGVGASAGGLHSIIEFFENLPTDTGVSYVVILHLPANYRTQLNHVIARHTGMPVQTIEQDQIALPDHVYILPGKFKLQIRNGVLIPSPRNGKSINRVIDDFFVSLAQEKKEKSIGIIFSGSSCNGAKGVSEIHKHHGIVLVQNPLNAEYSSMPDAAIKANNPDEIALPRTLAKNLPSIIEISVGKKKETSS
jgi:two-component system CheB/CheR fusion protein